MSGWEAAVIRTLRPEDLRASMELSQFAFQYELGPEELQQRVDRMNPEESWGIFTEEGSLAAKLMLLPFETYIGGKKYDMGGIAGVATWPEYRRGGLVARLLSHALRVMKERGQTISFLHPFQFAFYRKFGWESYTDWKRYELLTAQIPRFQGGVGRVERTSDLDLLSVLYDEYAARFNGSLVRSRTWWEQNIMERKNKGGTSAVYYGPDGSPKGYLLYKVRDKVMAVNEFVFLDEEARRGLWSFIANHDSMIDKVKLEAHSGDRLTSLLSDPRIKQETQPYFMARLVDAASFLKNYDFTPGVTGRLRLYVKDDQADWNEGLYELELAAEGKAQVRFRPRAVPEHPEDGLVCGTGALTAMLLGYERPSFMLETGRLHGSMEACRILDAAIPRSQTYLMDFF